MQNQAEEIALLPTAGQPQRLNETQTVIKLQSRTNDYVSSEKHPNTIIRLIKPVNRQILYINILLWVILPGCLILLAALFALHFSYVLPAVKPRTIPLHEFSEERARHHYINLTQYGPRVVNTCADYHTRDFLISKIYEIREYAKKSIRFEVYLQNFTVLERDQLQNIAVRVSNRNSSPNTPSLMLVAHYDSVELSPGASDDGSGVVVLLELLSNLVNDPSITFTDVNLIVLFTSGEELYLLGADEFVRRHPWKDHVRRFINLDSIGGNEKAILFRAKPSQIIEDYKKVPRPHANVIGDDALELTGSDTDYTSFTRKGYLFGYDFAFYLDGYNYHTILDKPSIVERGALQHLGENTLVLSRNILLGQVNLQQPETIIDDDKMIYFDILGCYLVTYKSSTSVIIQSILIGLVVVIGLLMIIIDHIWYNENKSTNDFSSVYFYFKCPLLIRIISIFIFFICYILSMVFGILLAAIISIIIWFIRPLSWFGNPVLAYFLYGLPCLIGIILCEVLWTSLRRCILSKYPKKNPMELNTINHINRLCFNFERHWALLLIFVFLMSISIYTGIRSLYFILLWSIFICPIYLCLIVFEFVCRWMKKKVFTVFNEQGWYWLLVPYIATLIPLTHTLDMNSRVLRLAIPTMARIFFIPRIPQDFIICLIVVIPTILFFLIFIPNIQRIMNYGRALLILTICFLIVFIIACTRQPFTSSHPKLIRVQHISHSDYKLNSPKKFPMTIPVTAQKSYITVQSFDNLRLLPILDQIASKTGFVFNERTCSTDAECSFEDTTNRTLPFYEVELTSIDAEKYYRFKIRHASTYSIYAKPSLLVDVRVYNETVKPRTETVLDATPIFMSGSFTIEIHMERCDLHDSPFLVSLTEKLPIVVMLGSGRCHTLTDILNITVYH